jgi:hypothetical protein
MPPVGRDTFLQFYIQTVNQEILKVEPKRRNYTNISKPYLESLKRYTSDESS